MKWDHRMNLVEMVRRMLVENGYDGLYNPTAECACDTESLMEFCSSCGDCFPGYRYPCHRWCLFPVCDAPGEYLYHIVDSRKEIEIYEKVLSIVPDRIRNTGPGPEDPDSPDLEMMRLCASVLSGVHDMTGDDVPEWTVSLAPDRGVLVSWPSGSGMGMIWWFNYEGDVLVVWRDGRKSGVERMDPLDTGIFCDWLDWLRGRRPRPNAPAAHGNVDSGEEEFNGGDR